MKKKGRIGSSFDDYLKEEGIYEEVTARAIKRVIARQLDALMADQDLTKSELAKHGLDPAPGTRDELAGYIARETEKWGKVVRAAKITGE